MKSQFFKVVNCQEVIPFYGKQIFHKMVRKNLNHPKWFHRPQIYFALVSILPYEREEQVGHVLVPFKIQTHALKSRFCYGVTHTPYS